MEPLTDIGRTLVSEELSGTVFTSAAAAERHIHELWKSAAGGEGDAARPAVTRACVLNLVCFQERPGPLTPPPVLIEVTRHLPARIVLVYLTGALDPEALRIEISAYCHMRGSQGGLVCCEELAVSGGLQACDRVISTVQSLLVADVPVALWQIDAPAPHPVLAPALMPLATVYVTDSRTFARDETLDWLAAQSIRETPAISDLNWLRALNWRNMIAQIFDPPPYRGYTDQVNMVEIRYAAGAADHPAQALLTGAWMADRLGWAPANGGQRLEGNRREWRMSGNGMPRRLVFQQADADGMQPGDIVSVHIEAPHAEPPMVFRIEPGVQARNEWVLVVETAGTCAVPVAMPGKPERPAAMLAETFSRRRRYVLLDRALQCYRTVTHER